MNEKWADYVITAVEYNSQHTHIIAVEVREDLGATLGGSLRLTRQNVVDLIRSGKRFVTATPQGEQFVRGEDVRVLKIGGIPYLRTDNNALEKDNLGKLRELTPS